MDPNANLEEQLRIAARIVAASERGDFGRREEADAERLADLVLALNDWLQNGGFMPRNWSKP